MKDIVVSVTIIAYNQEKLIARAIDSVLTQKTNFEFEIIIGDDCSTDNTRDVIDKYVADYPEIIRKNYQEFNVGTTKNHLSTARLASGKYICNLEGDDYWIDENKLQTQVDFLDKNKEYVGVSHKLIIEEPIKGMRFYSEPKHIRKNKEITLKMALNNKFFSATSCMYRNFYQDLDSRYEQIYTYHRIVGDGTFCIYLLSRGKVYALNKVMSAYSCFQNNNYNGVSKAFDIHKTQFLIWKKNEEFYDGKINFNKLIFNNLIAMYYESIRRKRRKDYKEIKKSLTKKQRCIYNFTFLCRFSFFMVSKIFAKLKINRIRKQIKGY